VDSCRTRKVLSQKVEECKVEHPQRVVSHYFQKVEECKMEHPQRVVSRYFQNSSTKSIEDLIWFMYRSEKKSSLRECVKKSTELPPKISKDSLERDRELKSLGNP